MYSVYAYTHIIWLCVHAKSLWLPTMWLISQGIPSLMALSEIVVCRYPLLICIYIYMYITSYHINLYHIRSYHIIFFMLKLREMPFWIHLSIPSFQIQPHHPRSSQASSLHEAGPRDATTWICLLLSLALWNLTGRWSTPFPAGVDFCWLSPGKGPQSQAKGRTVKENSKMTTYDNHDKSMTVACPQCWCFQSCYSFKERPILEACSPHPPRNHLEPATGHIFFPLQKLPVHSPHFPTCSHD